MGNAHGHGHGNGNGNGNGNRITEEKNKLDELTKEFSRKKTKTIHLNFTRFILFKKYQEIQKIVDEVKNQTGIESLDNLSKYLEMSTKTNSLFETDIKNLNQQKIELEKEIKRVKQEYQKSECLLNDTSSRKLEYLEKIKLDLKNEENFKIEIEKKLFTVNRVIDVLSVGFKKICKMLKLFDSEVDQEAEVYNYNIFSYFNFYSFCFFFFFSIFVFSF
jgi:hypothetical protein